MGTYTLRDDPLVDAIIQEELDYIVQRYLQLLGSDIISIILVGGFGRGEGGVVREEQTWRPVNDYDLLVVVQSPKQVQGLHGTALDTLLEQLDRAMLVKQVDVALVSELALRIPGWSVVRYENRWGSQVLYGTRPVKIRAVPAKWIPLCEGTTYYRTRAAGLLIAGLLLCGEGTFSDVKRCELAALEINKAYLAIGDALLLQYRRYHYSYRERRRRVNRLEAVSEKVSSHFNAAVQQKLYPDFRGLSLHLLESQWAEATSLFLDGFLRFEGSRLGYRFADLGQYAEVVQPAPAVGQSGVLSSLWAKVAREARPDIKRLRVAEMLLLAAKLHGDRLLLRQAAGVLAGASDRSKDGIDWAGLTKSLLREWHPGGIVADLTGSGEL